MTQWNNIKQVSTEFETKEGSFYLASVVLVFILINNSKGGRPCHKAWVNVTMACSLQWLYVFWKYQSQMSVCDGLFIPSS